MIEFVIGLSWGLLIGTVLTIIGLAALAVGDSDDDQY